MVVLLMSHYLSQMRQTRGIVGRLNKFQKTFFGAKKMAKSNARQISLKNYAEYALREGSVIEKREFLGCIKSRFILAKKVVKIQK